MVFTMRVQGELSRVRNDNACCQISELSALTRFAGTVTVTGAGVSLRLPFHGAQAARRAVVLLRSAFAIRPEIAVTRSSLLHKGAVFEVRVGPPDKPERLLQVLGILGKGTQGAQICAHIPAVLLGRKCCKKAFLRGAFLARGYIADPERGYHLELSTQTAAIAEDTAALLRDLAVPARVSSHAGGDEHLVYVKESEGIVNLLGLMGAHSSMLEMEKLRVVKGVRNEVNRLVNCETANLEKTVDAALRQVAEVRRIEQTLGLSGLPAALRQAARARLARPEASLAELGESMRPPISKSAVNHRLRRLSALSGSLEPGTELRTAHPDLAEGWKPSRKGKRGPALE